MRARPEQAALRLLLAALPCLVIGGLTPLPFEGPSAILARVIGTTALLALFSTWAARSLEGGRSELSFRFGLAITSGIMLYHLAAPVNAHWLHWFVLLPMFWVVRPGRKRTSFLLGWAYGTAGVGALFAWIATTIPSYSNVPVVAAWAITLLFASVFALQYPLLWMSVHPLRKRLGPYWVLAFPAVQVVIEWLSMQVFLFPYNHGVSQFQVPYTWQIISVTGVSGLTWLLFFVNSVLAESMYRLEEQRALPTRWVGSAAILVSAVIVFGGIRYQRVENTLQQGQTLRFQQLQSSMTMLERLNLSYRCVPFFDWYDMTSQLEPGSADLSVWPEGASPYPLNLRFKPRMSPLGAPCQDIADPAKALKELAASRDVHLLVGSAAREPYETPEGQREYLAYNTVYHVDPDSSELGRYDKIVPLPFGEYFPFGDMIPYLRQLIRGIGNFRAGTEPVSFDVAGVRMAVPICYEAILPGVCNRFTDAGLLVNVTNDGWFGSSAAPYQHAMLAVTRSTELGMPMIRSAYTGLSMIVEPHGRIHHETQPFERINRIVPVRVAQVPTVYRTIASIDPLELVTGTAAPAWLKARFGLAHWFSYLCGLGLVLGLLVTRRR